MLYLCLATRIFFCSRINFRIRICTLFSSQPVSCGPTLNPNTTRVKDFTCVRYSCCFCLQFSCLEAFVTLSNLYLTLTKGLLKKHNRINVQYFWSIFFFFRSKSTNGVAAAWHQAPAPLSVCLWLAEEPHCCIELECETHRKPEKRMLTIEMLASSYANGEIFNQTLVTHFLHF